jgi:ribonuclease J
MPATLTVYDGATTIGGTKILLEDGGAAVLLDFGTSFDARGRYFEEFLPPRSRAGLVDLIHMGLLPPLWGIYRTDMVDPAGRARERARRSPHFRELTVQAVLLSHAHMDHCGYISFLDPGIPIVSTAMTAYLAKAIQDAAAHQFEGEMAYAIPKVADEEGNIGSAPPKDFPYVRRPYRVADAVPADPFDFWNLSPAADRGRYFPPQPLQVAADAAGLPVRFFPVDHSIYGAAAVAVQTSAGWVVYTGDLRRHGRHRDLTDAFVHAARALQPVALVCEGTNIDRPPGASEEQAFQASLQAVEHARGELVVADFGPRNVERLLAFVEIARHTGRRLVITDKDAYLLWAMHAVDPAIPTPATEPTLVVYRRRLLRPDRWVEMVREWFSAQVTAADVGARPGDFILCFSFFDVTELIDVDPPGGVWIYSASEPHTEEQLFELSRLRNWLHHFRLRPLGVGDAPSPYHSSGHISGPELGALIRQIAPAQVIPVHTTRPDLFADLLRGHPPVTLPQAGAPLAL